MFAFFASDFGKVALGGLIAVVVQIVMFGLVWAKEHRVSSRKRELDAQYLAIQIVLALDKLIGDCLKAVYDPTTFNASDGCTYNIVDNPVFTLPNGGDYRALPFQIMYEVMFMPNHVASINEGLQSVWDESSPPDHDDYYVFRWEILSTLGLKADALVEALCKRYKIPPPGRPDHYDPKRAFLTKLAELGEIRQKNEESVRNAWNANSHL